MQKTFAFIFILFLLIFLTGCEEEVDSEPIVSQDVLYLGLMIHIEGFDDEVENEIKFQSHAKGVRLMADTLEKYGAVGTFESGDNFVSGCENWNDNVLKELSERGHGIGVHADAGVSKNLVQNAFIKILKNKRLTMERITGLEIKHASGICSSLDWAKAAIEAGYEFTTGGVEYCTISLSKENIPENMKECDAPQTCHATYPYELEKRINPWRVSTATDWLNHDPNGDLVILSSDGVLFSLNEEKTNTLTYGGMGDMSEEDIEVSIEKIEESLNHIDPNKVNILYFAWSIGDPARVKDPLLEQWLQAIQPYIESGQVEWKTLPEIYDAYIDIEN